MMKELVKRVNGVVQSKLTTLGGTSDVWLIEMLKAAGVLVQLSDSSSLVANPFDGGEIAL